jgi:FkbM family methyltransferase
MIYRLRALTKAKNILKQGKPDEKSLESWLIDVLDADIHFYKSTFLIADKLWFLLEHPFIKWFVRKGKLQQEALYDKLEAICLSPEKDRLQFGSIQLPRAAKAEKYLLTGEFVDMVVPYLMRNQSPEFLENLCSKFTESEGPYEPDEHVRLESGDVVIDAGANFGMFSVVGSARGCQVYAFEPMPYVIGNYLSKTAAWNQNITVCPYALWDQAEELTFEISQVNTASASAVIETGYKGMERVQVQAISLDEFVRQNHLDRVDFIKADIEGAERNMLQGAKEVLKKFAPKLSICTYHRPDDPRVIRKLIQEGNPNYIITEGSKKIYAYVPK